MAVKLYQFRLFYKIIADEIKIFAVNFSMLRYTSEIIFIFKSLSQFFPIGKRKIDSTQEFSYFSRMGQCESPQIISLDISEKARYLCFGMKIFPGNAGAGKSIVKNMLANGLDGFFRADMVEI